jgi:hypothetical protein
MSWRWSTPASPTPLPAQLPAQARSALPPGPTCSSWCLTPSYSTSVLSCEPASSCRRALCCHSTRASSLPCSTSSGVRMRGRWRCSPSTMGTTTATCGGGGTRCSARMRPQRARQLLPDKRQARQQAHAPLEQPRASSSPSSYRSSPARQPAAHHAQRQRPDHQRIVLVGGGRHGLVAKRRHPAAPEAAPPLGHWCQRQHGGQQVEQREQLPGRATDRRLSGSAAGQLGSASCCWVCIAAGAAAAHAAALRSGALLTGPGGQARLAVSALMAVPEVMMPASICSGGRGPRVSASYATASAEAPGRAAASASQHSRRAHQL